MKLYSLDGKEIFDDAGSLTFQQALESAAKKKIPLIGLDAKGRDLRMAKLSGLMAPGANFSQADLRGAWLTSAVLDQADLSYAWLDHAKLLIAQATRCDLTGTRMISVRLDSAKLREAFTHDPLVPPNLDQAVGPDACFESASLPGLRARKAVLTGASFLHADIGSADFRGADLIDANLQVKTAPHTQFDAESNLKGAVLEGDWEFSSLADASGISAEDLERLTPRRDEEPDSEEVPELTMD